MKYIAAARFAFFEGGGKTKPKTEGKKGKKSDEIRAENLEC